MIRRRPRLRRRPRPVGVAVLVLVVVTTALVAYNVRDDRHRERRREVAAATSVATRYLSAWEKGDWEAMRLLASAPPADFADYHAKTASSLHLASGSFQLGGVRVRGSRATATFHSNNELRGVGAWDYDGALKLSRHEPEQWRILWSPTAVHPVLASGESLELARTVPERAPILAHDGQAMTSRGPGGSLVGTVRSATTAEATPESGVDVGDDIGVSGLQASLQKQLAGRATAEVRVIDAGGNPVRTLQHFEGATPVPAHTTIDLPIQTAAEQVMAGVGRPAALVAIDAPTGEVRAAVSVPFGGFQRALVGQYPPGSTFKVITATAALRDGVTLETPIECPAGVAVNGKTFTNAEDEQLGTIPFQTAFAHSCNTAFVNLAKELTPEQLESAAETYGFGAGEGFGLPLATYGGSFPDSAGPVEHVADALGQGTVLASPLQMATVAAAVDAGAWRAPRLLIDTPPGRVEVIEPSVADALRQLMRSVVTSGTGTAADVPGGPPVSGKTGTAEFGNENPPRTHAWFIGFRGDLAFAIVVEGGGFGGEVAAPLAARFLRQVP